MANQHSWWCGGNKREQGGERSHRRFQNERQNFWKRELWRGRWSMQWLCAVCAEDYLSWNDYQLPHRYLNLDQVWFGFDVSGENTEIAAQDVTLKHPAQTFYNWIKRLWPTQHDEYAIGNLPIRVDSCSEKCFVFFFFHAGLGELSDLWSHALQAR